MKYLLLILVLCFANFSSADNAAYSAMKQIRESGHVRYILAKGNSLVSPIEKLKEHGKLASPRTSITYNFEVATNGLWTVFKLPDAASHWMHHNITYWFLGWGQDDPNYADAVVGLAINHDGLNYVIYGTNDASAPQDSLHGQMSSGTSFFINIPFDELVINDDSERRKPPGVVSGLKLPDGLEFSNLSIEYHESLGQKIH